MISFCMTGGRKGTRIYVSVVDGAKNPGLELHEGELIGFLVAPSFRCLRSILAFPDEGGLGLLVECSDIPSEKR